MYRSSALARFVTTLVTLLAVPTALLALSIAGGSWLRAVVERASFAAIPPSSLAWAALGLGLLLMVALLGIWSSAGLLASGIFAIFFTLATIFPALTVGLSRLVAETLPGLLGWNSTLGLTYGAPLLITLALPAAGVALAFSRRRPARGLSASLLGTLFSPALLLLGTVLVVSGIAIGLVAQMRTFQVAPQLVPSVLVLIGAALIVLGVAAARWAPFALIIPGLAAIVVTGIFATPFPYRIASRLGSLGPLRANDLAATTQGASLTGAGPGLAVLFLAFTVALLAVRQLSAKTNGKALHQGSEGARP